MEKLQINRTSGCYVRGGPGLCGWKSSIVQQGLDGDHHASKCNGSTSSIASSTGAPVPRVHQCGNTRHVKRMSKNMILGTKWVAVVRYEPILCHNEAYSLCGPFKTTFDVFRPRKIQNRSKLTKNHLKNPYFLPLLGCLVLKGKPLTSTQRALQKGIGRSEGFPRAGCFLPGRDGIPIKIALSAV